MTTMGRHFLTRIDAWTGIGAVAVAVLSMALLIPLFVPVFSPPRPIALAPWMLPQAARGDPGLAGGALAWRATRTAPEDAWRIRSSGRVWGSERRA